MKRNTFAYKFYCRKQKAGQDGLSPIEISISINCKRVFLNLPYRCKAEDFNRKRKPQEIESYLDTQRVLINQIVADMAQNGIPLTAEALRIYYRNGGFKSYTVEDMFNDFLAIQKKRVGKSLTLGVYKKYEYVRDLFYKTLSKDAECTSITNQVVRLFFTEIDGKYESSTAAGYKTKFKAFVRFAQDNGKIKINPFQGIKITKEKKPITYLTKEEIDKIKNVKLDTESLEKVRDCAIFQIGSGLAYADCVSLTPQDVQEKDGVYYISKNRNKTGNNFTAVLFPSAVKIWQKYSGKLPFISNQKYNLFLKVLGARAGVSKKLHSHLFRHTYATVLLNSGVSLKTTSRCLGDTVQVCNQHYAHLLEQTVLQEVSKVI